MFRDDGRLKYYVDGKSDPENWLKLINCARSLREQNVNVLQDGERIFYEASREISPGQELLVWYGSSYELYMGLPIGLKKRGRESTKPNVEGWCISVDYYSGNIDVYCY